MKAFTVFGVLATVLLLSSAAAAQQILNDPPAGTHTGTDGDVVPRVTFSDYEPKWSQLDRDGGNLRWIRVTGCGFRTYAEVVCVWDFKFTSTHSFIADDNTIICELPELEKGYFKTLPQNSRLDVVFDGDHNDRLHYVGTFRWGPQIDCLAPLEPANGPASGSTQVTITGEGFSDTKLTDLKVFFDGMPATSASAIDDTHIVATTPASPDIHRDALVSISWQVADEWNERGDVECYLHSHRTFHYGPLVTGVRGCGRVRSNSGNRVVIEGVNFADGLFNENEPIAPAGNSRRSGVLLEITLDTMPTTTSFGDRKVYQVEVPASQVSSTSISFEPPNPFRDSDENPDAAYIGQTASVDIYYRQTKRFVSIGAATFVYGPVITSIEPAAWHYGGGEEITLHGCGFQDSAFTDDSIEVQVGSQEVCEDPEIFAFANTNGDRIECTAIHVDDLCTDSTGSRYAVDVEWVVGTAETFWQSGTYTLEVVDTGVDVHIGPAFTLPHPQTSRGPVQDSTITVTGERFLYAAGSSPCNIGSSNCSPTGWTAVRVNGANAVSSNLLSERDLFDFSPLISATGTAAPTNGAYLLTTLTDTTISMDVGTAVFGDSVLLSFDFDITGSASCSYDDVHQHTFGPQCEGIEAQSASATWTSGPLAGNEQVSVFVSDFGAYNDGSSVTARLCQRNHNGNTPRDTWPATLAAPGGASRNPCYGNATEADTGSYERYANLGRSTTSDVTEYTFTTKAYATAADLMRGRRVWGSDYDIVVYFPSAQNQISDTGNSDRAQFDEYFSRCVDWSHPQEFNSRESGGSRVDAENDAPCETSTSLECGIYRFGPVVDGIAPCKGSMGPKGPAIATVTLSGSDFADPWSNAVGDDDHIVSFGTLIGEAATTAGNSQLTVSTVWGEPSHTDATVTVFFNTCNMTAVPDKRVHWGPRFNPTPITWSNDGNHVAVVDDDVDIYGLYPVAEMDPEQPTGQQFVDIAGIGFREFCNNQVGNCGDYHARCIIDGVRTDASVVTTTEGDANPGLRCVVPYRPFGTAAKVCVEFGEAPCNDQTDPWLDGEPEMDWTRTLCVEDQKLWFTPIALSVSPDDGHSSGMTPSGGAEQITVHGEGFHNWEHFGEAELRVGQYAADGPRLSFSESEVVANVPKFSGEFNSDASVQVYLRAPEEDQVDRYDGCTDETLHWKVWAPETYHYGPVCTGVAERGSGTAVERVRFLGQDDSDNPEIMLIGRHFVDCDAIVTDQCDNDDVAGSQRGICRQPQVSDDVQYPYDLGEGSRQCLHRRATVSMEWVPQSGSSRTINNIQVTNDTLAADNTDGRFDIELPNIDDSGDVECGYGVFTMDFYDALVVDDVEQRQIECLDDSGELYKLHYGPTINAFTHYNIRAEDGIAYGWSQTDSDSAIEDWKITVSGVNWADDDYIIGSGSVAEPEYEVRVRFDGSEAALFDDGDNFAVFEVPASTWQDERNVVARFSDGSDNICETNIGTFHYGPILLSSSRDGCTAPVPLDVDDREVTITGHAFNCCGYDQLTGTGGLHKCWTSTQDMDRDTHFRPTALTLSKTGSITCHLPSNDDPADWLTNFGVVFGVTNDEEDAYCDEDDSCDVSANGGGSNNQPLNHPHSRVGRASQSLPALNACYGPKLNAATFRVRMSGFAPTEQDLNIDDDDGTIEGARFTMTLRNAEAAITDHIESVFCEYEGSAEAAGSREELDENGDGIVTCLAPRWHAVCGQPDETLQAVFTMDLGESDPFTYEQQAFTTPTSGGAPSFVAESGDALVHTVKYGPYIAEDDTTVEDFTPEWAGEVAGEGDADDVWYFWTHNNAVHETVVRPVVSLAKDWLSDDEGDEETPKMWGTETGLCLFGRDLSASPRMRRHTEYSGESDFRQQHAIATYPSLTDVGNSDGRYSIDCPIPDGNMGEEGRIWVLLDPHTDGYTSLYSDDDTDPLTRDVGYWRWMPYATTFSNAWSAPNGLEAVTVYGGGFCPYDRVYCRFEGSSSYDAVQGDILDNTMVLCQAPPGVSPMNANVALYFNSPDCEGWGCDSSVDSAVAAEQYAFAGVTDVWPRHGPVHGNTPVYFEHIGFDNFNSLECVWHVDGTTTTVPLEPAMPVANDTQAPPAGAYECVSPSADEAQLAQVEIIGYYNNFGNSSSFLYARDLGCVWFDFGLPTIDSIEPFAIEWQRGDTVTVTGSYFNGGASNETGTFECWWQVGATPATDDPRDLGTMPEFGSTRTVVTSADKVDFVQSRNGKSFNSFRLLCQTPAERLEVIGAYPFEVIFDDFRTSDYRTFDVTQRSDRSLSGYDAEEVTSVNGVLTPVIREIGGVYITVAGESLGGGRIQTGERISSYLCRFDSSDINDDPDLYTVGAYDHTNEVVVCLAPPRNISLVYGDSDDDNDDEEETFPVSLSVSLDSGYTWTTPIDVLYVRDSRASCLEEDDDDSNAAPTLVASIAFIALIALIQLFF